MPGFCYRKSWVFRLISVRLVCFVCGLCINCFSPLLLKLRFFLSFPFAFCSLKLIAEKFANQFSHRILARTNSQPIHLKNREKIKHEQLRIISDEWFYLGLAVGFQSQQTSYLLGTSVNNTSTHVVFWIRINPVQQFHARTDQFRANVRRVDRLSSLKYFLSFLV